MNHVESNHIPTSGSQNATVFQQFVRWWREHDLHDRYLADATDHADLERRQRILERANVGPTMLTFNH